MQDYFLCDLMALDACLCYDLVMSEQENSIMSKQEILEAAARADQRKRKNAIRSEALRQRYRNAGFKTTVINIAPGSRGEVQNYAYKIAEKEGIYKP